MLHRLCSLMLARLRHYRRKWAGRCLSRRVEVFGLSVDSMPGRSSAIRSSLSSGVLPMAASRDPAAGVARALVRERFVDLIVGIWCMSVKIGMYSA